MSRFAHPTPSRSAVVEKLEDRIAPAVLVNPKTLTFFDTDGDLVTLTISKGTLTAADFGFDTAFDSGNPQQLQLVDFASDHDKIGADLSITAQQMGTGNGSVNVGYINATGIDLGKITIDGDLGRIDAGNANIATPAIKRLDVGSIGSFGTATQASGGSLTSNIKGALNALATTGDVDQATILVAGPMALIDIGGSLIGGDAAQSGAISAVGTITLAHVAEDVEGGGGTESGEIVSLHNIGTVVVDGSIIGGTVAGLSLKSGRVFAGGKIGLAVIGHDIIGGVGEQSGQLGSVAGMGVVQVAGSVLGGAGVESGVIGSAGRIETISITDDLTGYIGSEDGDSNGSLLSKTSIGRITIGGDINGGDSFHSGVIATQRGLGNVTVQGDLNGGEGDESGAIGSDGPVGIVKVMGDVNGDGFESGRIVSKQTINSVIVGGSVNGGVGRESGSIGALGLVKSVLINGDLFGGQGDLSGWINSEKKLGNVTVVGSLGTFQEFNNGISEGVTTQGRTTLFGSGLISGPVITKITVGTIGSEFDKFDPGVILGGAIDTIIVNNSIYSGPDLGAFIGANSIKTITVTNQITGRQFNSSSGTGPVVIEVRDSLGSLTVGRNVSYLQVIAGSGFDTTGGPLSLSKQIGTNGTASSVNPDAQIGTIHVSGNWTESSVVAGVLAGSDGNFGTLDDEIVDGGNASILSTIARIQIDGQIFDGSGSDDFGFEAQHVKTVVVGSVTQPLTPGAKNDAEFLNLAGFPSVFVRENNTFID